MSTGFASASFNIGSLDEAEMRGRESARDREPNIALGLETVRNKNKRRNRALMQVAFYVFTELLTFIGKY